MRSALVIFSAGMIILGAGQAAAHDCFKPEPPALINKDTALPEERSFFEARLDTYVTLLNQYFSCLQQADAEARQEAQYLLDAWALPDEAVEVVIE